MIFVIFGICENVQISYKITVNFCKIRGFEKSSFDFDKMFFDFECIFTYDSAVIICIQIFENFAQQTPPKHNIGKNAFKIKKHFVEIKNVFLKSTNFTKINCNFVRYSIIFANSEDLQFFFLILRKYFTILNAFLPV